MSSKQIDWDNLRVFRVVAEFGSLSAAAAQLGESPPTIGRKIDDLEENLKTQLFTRSTRGVELTEAGKTVLRHANRMAKAAEIMEQEAGGVDKDVEGSVTLMTGDGLGPYWIAPRLKEFHRRNPRVQVKMHVTDETPDVVEGPADMAIQFVPPDRHEVISEPLGTLHYIGFASETYLAQRGVPTHLAEYYNHRIILHEGYVHQAEKWAPRAAELKRMIDYAFVTNSASAMILHCLHDGGIALLPTYIKQLAPGLVPIRMPEVAPIQFWLTYTEAFRRQPQGRAAINWVKSIFDSATTPWFRDVFVHPDDANALMQSGRLSQSA